MESKTNKNYLIITPSISNLGGAQLYVLRRAKYLISNGYCVKFIVSHHNSGNFILENKFAEIPVLHLNQIRNPILLYSKKKIDSIICTIQLFLKEFNNGIVETNSLQLSVWGELISSKLNLKHIIYLLAEPRASAYGFYPGYNFFEYKLNRGEFYGTTEYALSLIFGKQIERDINNFVNVPFDPSELTELSIPRIETANIDENSFIIGTITRLEKLYLKPFIESCIRLARKHEHMKFTLIIAGGSEDVYILNHLNESYNPATLNIPNLYILFTGYIKLLGRDFFKILDVFAGQGTASINAISQGCATLNIDPITNQCSGIFGVDVENFAYPKNGNIYKIEDKLESLMLDIELFKLAKLKGPELFDRQYSVDFCFNNLDNLINSSSNEDKYYPFRFSIPNRIKDKLKSVEGFIKMKIYKGILYLVKTKK
jgi:hypothetical protein